MRDEQLPAQEIMAVPGNLHIEDARLLVASFNVSDYRKQMLPNKEAILSNPSLRYLSLEQRAKLIEAPPTLVKQLFSTLLENINNDIGHEFTHMFRIDGRRVESIYDIDQDCKIVLLGREGPAPTIYGIEEYFRKIPEMKHQAIVDLYKKRS